MSLGGSSEVLNENQDVIYKVKGKIFTLTKKKKMYDTQGNRLYTIRNKYWNFGSRSVLVYDADGERVATIRKKKYKFDVNFEILDTEDEMSIEGKFFGRDCRIMKNGKAVATITRDLNFVRDAFTLEAEEKDIPFFAALTIAFDNMKDKLQNEKN